MKNKYDGYAIVKYHMIENAVTGKIEQFPKLSHLRVAQHINQPKCCDKTGFPIFMCPYFKCIWVRIGEGLFLKRIREDEE